MSKLEITHYNILIASHIDLIKETQRDIVIKSLKFILTALVCHFEDKINANISTVYISKTTKNIQIEYTAKLEITEIQIQENGSKSLNKKKEIFNAFRELMEHDNMDALKNKGYSVKKIIMKMVIHIGIFITRWV